MDDTQALTELVALAQKSGLTEKQREAIKFAIGVLSWTKLRSAATKSIRPKQAEKRKRAIS